MGQTWTYMANETLQYPVSHVKDVLKTCFSVEPARFVLFFPPKNVETSFDPSNSRHEESWCYCIKMGFL